MSNSNRPTNPARKGLLAMLVACTIWGLSALYYAQLRHVPPLEVLSWRTLSSLVFFTLVLGLQGRLGQLVAAFRRPRELLTVTLAGVMIAVNWFGFIYSIQTGRAVEASLGYYIFPLVAVLLGRLAFGETLSRWQWLSVALAALAVAVLTLGLGVPPWISLLLALTFGTYGLLKKRLQIGPITSVTLEVLLLAPLALAWVLGRGAGLSWDLPTLGWLAGSGVLTGLPLVLFAYATQRVRLSTLGLVQYLNPTLQFMVATLIFAEPFTRWHAIAFPMIWLCLAIYTAAGWRAERRARRG